MQMKYFLDTCSHKTTKTKVFWSLLVPIVLLLFSACFKNSESDAVAEQLIKGSLPGGIRMIYPSVHTVFPPDIAPPRFIWADNTGKSDAWHVFIGLDREKKNVSFLSTQQEWKPDRKLWNHIQSLSLEQALTIHIAGVKQEEPRKVVSSGNSSFSTSRDSVGAAIFFRDVILPFDSARRHVDSIRYRLADISSEKESRVLMSGLPVCGNCHSFSRDGNTLGMDVDYANDKGSYVISDIAEHTVISPDKIISWSEFKKEEKQLTFGLLSQISPDGRYVASTVKDRSIFVPVGTSLAYSQLFFPIKGILVIYDRKTKKFAALPGADNPEFVQSNPNWSPDGKHLYFARSKAYISEKIERSTSAVLPADAAAEFLNGERDFKFDIFRIPFNNGKGGRAVPVRGASENGMSNYFPRISPDGKWMVFTRSKNFMLLQPDSRLFIVPAEGGIPREMTCNTSEMNSWHSWSPNSRWLVFSSKVRGPYTRLYLTHINEAGEDSPPVFIENLLPTGRAANIPEFVNRKADTWSSLSDAFSDSGNYLFRVAKNKLHYRDFLGAESTFNAAAAVDPDNYAIYLEQGILFSKKGNFPAANKSFEKAINLAPEEFLVHYNIGVLKSGTGDLPGAIQCFNRALVLKPGNINALYRRSLVKMKSKDFEGAMADCGHILKINPSSPPAWNLQGLLKSELGNIRGALADFSQAILLDNSYPDPYLNRSYAKYQLNDTKSALKDLDTYNALITKLEKRKGR